MVIGDIEILEIEMKGNIVIYQCYFEFELISTMVCVMRY